MLTRFLTIQVLAVGEVGLGVGGMGDCGWGVFKIRMRERKFRIGGIRGVIYIKWIG
jgi:hypothetical protein